MKKKKILIITIVAIIIAKATFIIINNSKIEGRKYEIEKIEKYDFFLLRDDNKYGVIDQNANIIIDAKYDNIVIPNPSKDIFVCTIPDTEEKKVFNKNKEELFTNYEEVNAIKLKNIASDLMYEKSVLTYKQDGKYGIMDLSGKKLTKNIYDKIESLEYKEGELLVQQDGKYGVINIKGNVLIPIKYEAIDVDNYYTEENGYKKAGYITQIKTEEGYRYGYTNVDGKQILKEEYNEISRITDIVDENNIYFIVSKDGRFGVNKNEENIINYDYQSISYDKSNNIFIVEKSKKYGVADIKGKIIVPIEYQQIDISGKYLYVSKKDEETIVLNSNGEKTNLDPNVSKIEVANGKYNIVITNTENETLYGVQDNNGKQIIKPEYVYIEYLFNNYFIVCNKEGKLGILDDKEKQKVETNYDSLQKIGKTNLVQASIKSDKITQILNENLEEVCNMKDATLSLIDDEYIKISNNQEIKYFNNLGKEVKNTEVLKNNKLFAKISNGKWGFVDSTGAEKVEAIYEKVTEFNEFGFAGIKQNGKWGVIDSDGKVIEQPKYEFYSEVEPEFLGQFYKVTYGYGEIYFTNK